jgi:hypothetical protein
MKKFTSLLIGCALALAGAALAQQPTEQQSPTRQQTQAPGKTHKGKANRGQNAANPEATGMTKQHGMKHERAGSKGLKTEATPKSQISANKTGTNVSGQAGSSATLEGKQGRKGKNARGANAKTSPGATPATSVAATGQKKMKGKGAGAAKKLEPQKVQQIKSQHANFKAQPRPGKVPSVTFSASYRIQGSDHWQGPQYEVFRSYHPERHDRGWYHSHYTRVELISGGYYYFNNGYWFPAWGYSPSAEYYAYNGPIYVGHRAEPPDQVIADVQAALQDMGYYTGEVDGLLGPLTREALTAYQADQGLDTTAAIDEPTLDALGMG